MPGKVTAPKPKAAPVQRIRVRRNPRRQTLDDHDGRITLERLKEKRFSMDKVFREVGYEVER